MAWPDRERDRWLVIDHELVRLLSAHTGFLNTSSWEDKGEYSVKKTSMALSKILEPYVL
jgi:hypothetical protein